MTPDEFMRLPDNGWRYELVDGEAKASPLLNFWYGAIVCHVMLLLGAHARGRGSMTVGKAGFHMANGNIRCPAISFTRAERLTGGRAPDSFGDIAPDLCVEIISPSEDDLDMQRKVQEYFASGAQLVWQIFPETQTLIAYTAPSTAVNHSLDDELTAGDLLPGFRCRVAELFEVE